MSSELYSTNPTIVGGGLIVATACIVGGAAAPDVEYSVWPYVTVGFGLLFFGMALSITGSVGLSGMLRICSTVGALACGYAGWRFWPSAYFPLAITCAVAVPVLILWGWGHAWWLDRSNSP